MPSREKRGKDPALVIDCKKETQGNNGLYAAFVLSIVQNVSGRSVPLYSLVCSGRKNRTEDIWVPSGSILSIALSFAHSQNSEYI
jgi:hypothetical protein